MRQIQLPQPEKIDTKLMDVLRSRTSARGGNLHIPLTLQELGTLVGLALEKRPDSLHRNYPSGGALYPIETYVISTALESQEPGVFHYNPSAHVLERLWDLPKDFDMSDTGKYPAFLVTSTLIVFTSVWKRSSAKYGNFTYGVALLEVGHMSENLLLVGTALGLNLRPFAGFNDDGIAKLLDLDETQEQPVHAITISKGKSTHTDTAPVSEE
jgi:SagB-type dehydrogenase family enzyme